MMDGKTILIPVSPEMTCLKGTMRKKQKQRRPVNEPVIDRSEDVRHIHIQARLPGIPEEKIRIYLETNTLTLIASDDLMTFRKEILVPDGSRLCKKTFAAGLLNLTLEKTAG